ncbi:opioid growth factor receptor-related protein [Isosphaeraceae bacterium EP7]
MSRLTEFYRGEANDTSGRSLAEIQGYSDQRLESVHDFIQWLFPLRERSQFNPGAPLLTDADVAEFRADPLLRRNLLRSFDVFLAFLGLTSEDGKVINAGDFDVKSDVWRFPNHNWLRITRVLASTRMLGLEASSLAFYAFLKTLKESGRSGITDDTFGYWTRAAGGEN